MEGCWLVMVSSKDCLPTRQVAATRKEMIVRGNIPWRSAAAHQAHLRNRKIEKSDTQWRSAVKKWLRVIPCWYDVIHYVPSNNIRTTYSKDLEAKKKYYDLRPSMTKNGSLRAVYYQKERIFHWHIAIDEFLTNFSYLQFIHSQNDEINEFYEFS